MRLGVDMVDIERIAQAIGKTAFIERVYTPQEIAYCQAKKVHAAESFAGIYAAKEACLKALGCGMRFGTWQDLEVFHDEWGAPYIEVGGPFQEWMDQHGLTSVCLSITHTDTIAMAHVIAQD